MENKKLPYKITSLMLEYPEKEWVESSEISEVIQLVEDIQIKRLLNQFLEYVREHSIDKLCEEYVNTFDFSENTTLHLTYSQYSDKKERGAKLLTLKEQFRKVGLIVSEKELPDYLPLILEFASLISDHKILESTLEDLKEPLKNLYANLEEKNSPYRYLIAVCLILTNQAYPNLQEQIGGAV